MTATKSRNRAHAPRSKGGIVLSGAELAYIREAIEYAVCALQNEYVYLQSQRRLSEDAQESSEYMECAAEELQLVDALLESRETFRNGGRTH